MSIADLKTSTHTYKVVDGLALDLDILAPNNFQKDRDVALIHFHGGFLVGGEKTSFPPNWLIRACVSRGWAYVTPSYRLLPEAKGLDTLSDTVDAVLWVHQHTTKRIIVAGSSAGGYLALATTAHPRTPKVLAVLCIYGMLDPISRRYIQPGISFGLPLDDITAVVGEIKQAIKNGPVIGGYPLPTDLAADKRYKWIAAMHDEALYLDIMTRISGLSENIREKGVEVIPAEQRPLFPATFGLDKTFPPTALIHGDADVPVGFDLSDSVANKLCALGVNVLLEKVVGKGHGFDVSEVPPDVDIDVHGAGDPEFYDSFRRVVAFLGDAVETK